MTSDRTVITSTESMIAKPSAWIADADPHTIHIDAPGYTVVGVHACDKDAELARLREIARLSELYARIVVRLSRGIGDPEKTTDDLDAMSDAIDSTFDDLCKAMGVHSE